MSVDSFAKRVPPPGWRLSVFPIPTDRVLQDLIGAGFSRADAAWMLDLPEQVISHEAESGIGYAAEPAGR